MSWIYLKVTVDYAPHAPRNWSDDGSWDDSCHQRSDHPRPASSDPHTLDNLRRWRSHHPLGLSHNDVLLVLLIMNLQTRAKSAKHKKQQKPQHKVKMHTHKKINKPKINKNR